MVSADGSGPNDAHYATTTVYDAVGNTLSVTDPDGNATSYVYDNLNRLTQTIDPLHDTSSQSYDADGNVVRKTDRDGRTTQYVYDADGRQTQENWLDGNGNVFHAIQTSYDAAGQVASINESDTQNPANATSYQYAYDRDGQVLRARMAPGDLPQPGVSTSGTQTLTTGCVGPARLDNRKDWGVMVQGRFDNRDGGDENTAQGR